MENIKLIVNDNPKSPVAEAYRTLRTNLQFAGNGKELKIIEVTSAQQNEGKSTLISNLTLVLAHAGKKVLLIDCDLRNPTLNKKFALSNMKGITNYLSGVCDFSDCIEQIGDESLYVATTGAIPPTPSELLGSSRMSFLFDELRKSYDYVFVDTPPVLPVTDPLVISQFVDGVILVVEAERHNPKLVQAVKDKLDQVHANLLGCVLNKVKISDKRYGYGYGYGYSYSYGNSDKD